MSIENLREIMQKLRDPDHGCPWDKKQNFKSIAPYTIEEAYEVADAIERENLPDLQDELGDLLLQVVYHAQMAEEQGAFTFDDVAAGICDKMVRRHPHVFGEEALNTEKEVKGRWEEIKRKEREEKGEISAEPSVLDGVTKNLPGLTLANKIQKKAASVGFDWGSIDPIYDKIKEELAEVKYEVDIDADKSRVEDEIGDLLFAVVNLARHLKIDPESAMRVTNKKFETRFRKVEVMAKQEGQDMKQMSLPELDSLWDRVKRGN